MQKPENYNVVQTLFYKAYTTFNFCFCFQVFPVGDIQQNADDQNFRRSHLLFPFVRHLYGVDLPFIKSAFLQIN